MGVSITWAALVFVSTLLLNIKPDGFWKPIRFPRISRLLLDTKPEYDMSDGETLGGFLTWALAEYATPDTKTTWSIVTHGAPLVAAIELTTLFTPTMSLRAGAAGDPFYFPLGDIHVKPGLTDDYPQAGLITPHALQVALDMATNGGNNPLAVMDIVHCFSGSVEEFYELSNPAGTQYAEVIGGAANYSYFAPNMLGRALTNLDPSADTATLGTSIMTAYEQVLQEADDADGNSATTKHPYTMVLVDSSQLVAVKEKIDEMAWHLMNAFESAPIATTNQLADAYDATGTYYDLNYCPPSDWELAPPDGLVDSRAFLEAVAAQNISGAVTTHAQEAADLVQSAVISQIAKSGTPWFADPLTPTWNLSNSNASGLALYADLQGTAEGSERELSWHASFYTDTLQLTFPNGATIENNNPYLFVQGGYNGATWADVFYKYWQIKSDEENLTLHTVGCLPDLPPVLREGELSVEQLTLPANIVVGSPISLTAEIGTETRATNPLVRFSVQDASGSVVFSDTVAAGDLLTGTHPITTTKRWAPSMVGVFTLEVMVDPHNYFIEQNKNNNVATISDEVLHGTDIILALEPPTITAVISQTFEVPIWVMAGTQPVDGASAYLNFDPSVLEVITITLGSHFPYTLENSFDNQSGEVNIAAGTLSNYPSSTFTLATVTFRALAATSGSPIDFNDTMPRNSDVTFNGTSLLSDSRPSTVIVHQMSVDAFVTLEGRPNPPHPSWSVPLFVTLTIPGEAVPSYDFNVITDDYGHFSMTGITPGSYEVRVKKSNTLQNLLITELEAGFNSLNLGTLHSGDANNDNYVTLLDFSILASTFGKCEGNASYDERADFDGNDCIVMLDFSLLASHFGEAGDVIVPSLLAIESESNRGNSLDFNHTILSLEPSLSEIRQGEVVTVTVHLDTKGKPTDGVQVNLDFDPTLLQLHQMRATDAFPLILQEQFDNSSGTIDFAAGSLSESVNGKIDILTLQIEGIAASKSTELAFHSQIPRQTDSTFSGNSVLSSHTNGTLIIKEGTTAVTLDNLSTTSPHLPIAALLLALLGLTSAWLKKLSEN